MTDINKLRHRCFFDISIGDKNVGRIIFELFNDICPKTCDNFRSLCTGEKGLGKTTAKALHYKNVKFHRVVKHFIIQSGDFSMGNGRGGESIFGGTFDDENFVLRHDKPFLLSMANRGKNTNGSQFFITLNPAPHLDGVHVVFGHVLSGQQIVNEIQEQSTGEDGKPLLDVVITNCGELIPQIKPKDKKKKHKKLSKKSDGELSSDEEDRDETKAKKKKEKKHKKHKKSKENKKDENNDVNKEDKELEQLNDNCSVKPEEIPDIPENTFLFDERDRRWEPNRYNRYSSRRKVKGRGPTRYRTPSPHHYRSGSETPPHWRSAQANLVTLKEVIKQKESKDNREVYKPRKSYTSGYHRERGNRNYGRNYDRDYGFHKTNQRESSDTELKNNISGQPYQKRKFTEEPSISSKHLKSDSYSNKISNRRENQNENNLTSYVSDSENIKNSEIQRHSVKSEVKMSVRNKREDSRESQSEEHRHQSPSDIKNIPLPDSDTEKRNSNQKRSERTYDSHSKGSKREYRHRRSGSHEKDFSQKLSSRRRRHSNDSN